LVVATEQQRYDHLIAQRQPMSAREAELAEVIATRRAEITGFEKRLTTQAEESRTAESTIEKQTGQRADLEKALAGLTEQRRERSTTMNEAESNLRTIRNSLNDLRDSRSNEQVRHAELQLKIDNLTERVSRRYQINLREFSSDQFAFEKTLRAQLKRNDKVEDGTPATPGSSELAPPNVEKLIADLRTQLDNMGPVNLDAVHEYDELEERYKFLESQNSDLTNSRRELLDVIAQINSTTRKLFGETFAQVRTNFREMFLELFGGGRADLALLDENDPLNCGIEISAKPPGKQLQSVSLLSGGERSMVAVALLFAIYMVRPSPFCILDEVDAAMDEGNINRFIRVLDRFVEQSQFIIITHNKRTIAKADVLYGVTMEERGVSKLVGIKLTAPHPVSTETFANADQKPPQQRLALAMR
jgi:chromosome segregation protein